MSKSSQSEQPEVAVIGAGIVGLSTAYALLERGLTVRVYEHGVPGNGQSGGVSRIFRHAHDDPRMIAAAQASRQAYDEWGPAPRRRAGLERRGRGDRFGGRKSAPAPAGRGGRRA